MITGRLQTIWREAKIICIDFDSTIIQNESIGELACACGVQDEVAKLTRSAMEGSSTFDVALRKRLAIIKPTKSQVNELANKKTFLLTNGFSDLCKRLQDHNKQVFIISGGFKELIIPVSNQLQIPAENVFANELIFDQLGNYQDFVDLPTARTGGKLEVIKEIKKRCTPGGKVVHIGDGITDLETKEEVDLFIGFGGNIVRDVVKQQSEWFVTDFEELDKLLCENK